MAPLVSILIPAFNAERWIADTIRSALAQTWPRKEIIIVDDGSRDRTLSIAQQFASKEVSVVTQSNQGAAAARNKAFSLCQGDYIQWLDADDLLAPDKVARQIESAERCGRKRTLLSSTWGGFIYRPNKAKFTPTALWCDLSPMEWLLRVWEQNLFMQPATWLVSRELTEAVGPWDTRLSYDDDGEYFCRVVLASDGIRFVPEARIFYRRGFDSLSRVGRSDKKLESKFLSMQLQVGYLRSVDDGQRVRNACLKYLQIDGLYFYPERLDIIRQLQELARSLGGELHPPQLPPKYVWIQNLFGCTVARQVQIRCNGIRSSVNRGWDRALFRLGI
jgi:glycosyltransferase involved in cell wall biosynthesis